MFLDNDKITIKSKSIYDSITNEIINISNSEKLLLMGIGIETLIEYDIKLQNIVDNSKNIFKWIFPKDKKIDIQCFTTTEEKSDFLVYSLEEN